jgi:hypothetical protein
MLFRDFLEFLSIFPNKIFYHHYFLIFGINKNTLSFVNPQNLIVTLPLRIFIIQQRKWS